MTIEELRQVSRIGQDLTSIHDRKALIERAVSYLIHDLSYEGALVITGRRQGPHPPSAADNRSVAILDPMPVIVPIPFDCDVLGTIVIPLPAGRRLTNADLEMLGIFAEFLGIGLNNVRHLEEVRALAYVDPLTGVMNRRHFLEILPEELAKTRSTAIIAFDIDLFKAINDTFGHFAGDAVLRFVAERAKECMRVTDMLARMGGDEFLILLPGTRLQSARGIAERVRANIEKSPVKVKDSSVYCTVSVGIASVAGGVDLTSFMNKADQALYAAKHRGRNLVCSA